MGLYSDLGYVVREEVDCEVGRIDLILYRDMGRESREKIVVEIKERSGIKHGIGQLLAYSRYHSDCSELRLVYFCRDNNYRGIDSIYEEREIVKIDRRLRCVWWRNEGDTERYMRGLGKEEREDIGIGEIDLVEIDKYIGIGGIDRVDNIISSIEW